MDSLKTSASPIRVMIGVSRRGRHLDGMRLAERVDQQLEGRGPVISALAACGQRSLTCYLLQSVVFVVFAEVLRRNNVQGPAETLLRKLTYR